MQIVGQSTNHKAHSFWDDRTCSLARVRRILDLVLVGEGGKPSCPPRLASDGIVPFSFLLCLLLLWVIAPFSFLDVYVYHFVRMFFSALHAISLACVYARTTPAHPLFWARFLVFSYWFNNLVVVVSVASVASVALGRTWMGRKRHWAKGCVDEGCVGRRYTRCYLRVVDIASKRVNEKTKEG